MKPSHFLTLFSLVFLFLGCNQQPIGNTLLSAAKNGNTIEDTTSTPDDGDLDIQPDSLARTMNIDDSDKIEITGTCKDLDRKNNRILVDVIAGEDETTLNPYISNAVSDKCLTTDSGLPITDKCFWVTKGIGLIEDAGLATERTFPQCHNGRFGFSVKLGKILVPASGSYLKYTIRFKLRTLDGILSDTPFSRVTVTRGLNTPVINSAVFSNTGSTIQCKITTSPARFNFGILYSLARTYTDAAATANVPLSLYSATTTASIADGASVFSFNDFPTGGANIMIRGVTYNYTLTSTENNYSYILTPPTPTAASTAVTCDTEELQLSPTPDAPGVATCTIELESSTNPLWGGGGGAGDVGYEWGYNTSPSWRGPDLSEQSNYTLTTCGDVRKCVHSVGLVSGTTYYFAAREVGDDGQKGKWSELYQCKPL